MNNVLSGGKRNCNYCGTPQVYREIAPQKYEVTSGAHICARAEAERSAFMSIINTKGADYAMRKIQRLEAYRRYDRKYPYDSTSKAKDIDEVYDLASEATDPLTDIIAQESLEEFLAQLTPKQQEDALLYMQGYKPKDIAAMRGKDQSGAERWQKHNIKERLSEYL